MKRASEEEKGKHSFHQRGVEVDTGDEADHIVA